MYKEKESEQSSKRVERTPLSQLESIFAKLYLRLVTLEKQLRRKEQ